MRWRDVGTVETEFGKSFEVLHACPRCKALVCGSDVDGHDKWHEMTDRRINKQPDPRLFDPNFEKNR